MRQAIARGSGLVLLFLLTGCPGQPSDAGRGPILPETLGGLALVERATGDQARDLITQLHPGPLAPAESEVGFYASGDDRAILYVSRFARADTAMAQLETMSAMIGRGRGGFGHHAEAEIAGTVVHMVMGQGRAHFFFRQDREVVWVSADPETGRGALSQLLGVAPDSIPR